MALKITAISNNILHSFYSNYSWHVLLLMLHYCLTAMKAFNDMDASSSRACACVYYRGCSDLEVSHEVTGKKDG